MNNELLKETKEALRLWRSKKKYKSEKIPDDIVKNFKKLSTTFPKKILLDQLALSTSSIQKYMSKNSTTPIDFAPQKDFVQLPGPIITPQNSYNIELNLPGGMVLKIEHRGQ